MLLYLLKEVKMARIICQCPPAPKCLEPIALNLLSQLISQDEAKQIQVKVATAGHSQSHRYRSLSRFRESMFNVGFIGPDVLLA